MAQESSAAWLEHPPPLLTTRRACLLADCSRFVLLRSGPPPVGKRGRTNIYETKAILEWLRSGIKRRDPATSTPRRAPAPSADALARLRALRSGGAP